MIPQTEKDKISGDYHDAEKLIDQTIAGMEGMNHIEYGATIERRDKPRPCACIRRLLRRIMKR